MRKLIAAAFVTLDGVMQAPGAPEEDRSGGFENGGWVKPHWDDLLGEDLGQLFGRPFDLLLGRKTYDIFAAYWPYQPADDPIGSLFDRVAKYVVTSSTEPLGWRNSTALNGDPADTVRRLKQGDGPDLLTQGSAQLLQALHAAGLIDEYRLKVFPVVLGRGKRLFAEGAAPATLKLTEAKTSDAGVTLATYLPAGPVVTDSCATEEPSALELVRRERVAREG